MLFIHNKYYRTYYTIINRAIARKTVNEYSEKHHIIPVSLGGTKNKNNIAILTIREHILCHRLLPKFTIGLDKSKMALALWFITRPHKDRPKIKLTTREAAEIRKQMQIEAKNFPKPKGNIPWNKGKKIWSDEQKQQIGQLNRDRGRQSKETINKRVSKIKGQKRTTEQCHNIGNARRGQKWSEEQKQQMSIKRKGKPSPKKGIRTGLTGKKSKSSLTWHIMHKTGQTETVIGLREWCDVNNLNYAAVWKASNEKRWVKNKYYISLK